VILQTDSERARSKLLKLAQAGRALLTSHEQRQEFNLNLRQAAGHLDQIGLLGSTARPVAGNQNWLWSPRAPWRWR
jgi:hypothetical protein